MQQGLAALMGQPTQTQGAMPAPPQGAAPMPQQGQPMTPPQGGGMSMTGLGDINARVAAFRGNPQALQQRYSVSQDLLDLLALQKIKTEKEAAARQLQLSMNRQAAGQGQPAPTVLQQREQQVMDMTKQELQPQQPQGLGALQAPQGEPTGFAGGGLVPPKSFRPDFQTYQSTMTDPSTKPEFKSMQGQFNDMRNIDPEKARMQEEARVRMLLNDPEETKRRQMAIEERQRAIQQEFDPAKQRDRGLIEFLLGGGGRAYGELGAGARAAQSYDDTQSTARQQRMKEIEDMNQGLFKLRQDANVAGINAGSTHGTNMTNQQRTGLEGVRGLFDIGARFDERKDKIGQENNKGLNAWKLKQQEIAQRDRHFRTTEANDAARHNQSTAAQNRNNNLYQLKLETNAYQAARRDATTLISNLTAQLRDAPLNSPEAKAIKEMIDAEQKKLKGFTIQYNNKIKELGGSSYLADMVSADAGNPATPAVKKVPPLSKAPNLNDLMRDLPSGNDLSSLRPNY